MVLAALAAVAVALVLPSVAQPASKARAEFQDALVNQINELRADHGLKPLTVSEKLGAAAAEHAESMGSEGYFGHTTPSGRTFSSRVARFYPHAGAQRWAVGENLCAGHVALTATDCLRMWLDSPPHRRVLLYPGFRELGVSALAVDNAPGAFDGADTVIVVADFGFRS
jgi:uncharacterized protein YkwD